MNRLIVNTANEKLFIVLQTENNVFCKESEGKARHNEIMLPLIEELLAENNLKIQNIKEFGVVVGPGSFTGIRVGVATIKAFRDSLGVKAKGINNLDYLFALAQKQYKDIRIVAMQGSRDSYFVAKLVNGKVFKYEHNLTKDELSGLAGVGKIAMFAADGNVNSVICENDAEVLLECLKKSKDDTLTPVYYQLSQAESEKLKKGSVQIEQANESDIDEISNIESESIAYNTLSKHEIESILKNDNYMIYKTVFNNEIVGFVILEITDEVNIFSIAVKKDYRNLGFGTKLIDAAKEYARENEIENVSLEVSSNNSNAFVLYEKLGFEKRRVRKSYYQDGSDCVEMVLPVQV